MLALTVGCVRSPRAVELQPYESLLQILSDFASHRNDDLYRAGYPTDIAGMNLYHATLRRLENYQKLNPGQFGDIIAVSKGQLYERLGDYEAAVQAYSSLPADASPEMRAVAEQNLARLQELSEIARYPLDSSSLDRYLADLAYKRDGLQTLAQRFAGTPYQSLARVESEQADVERLILLFNSRYVLPDGLNAAFREANAFLKRHEGSALFLRHQLMVGDFYFTAAKDYASVHNPSRSGFRAVEFDPLVSSARELYFKVSQQDGAPEKLEARGKLQSLEAFMKQVNTLKPVTELAVPET